LSIRGKLKESEEGVREGLNSKIIPHLRITSISEELVFAANVDARVAT
jgi:hypothetical protein